MISSDAVLVNVGLNTETQRYHVLEILPKPQQLWRDVTSPTEIEQIILERDKRHLQQVAIEGGLVDHPIKIALRQENGVGVAAENLFAGRPIIEYDDIPPTLAAWLRHMKKGETEHGLPPVVGSMSMDEFQLCSKKQMRTLQATLIA